MKEQDLELQNTYDNLFYSHLYLVDILVKKFKYSFLDRDDLRQAGLMGLFQASLHFKKEKDVQFNTYATYYIIGEIKKEIRNNRLIKLSNKINKVKVMIANGYSLEEIKENTGFDDELINEAILCSDRVEVVDNVEYDKTSVEIVNPYEILRGKIDQLSKNRKLKNVVLVLSFYYFDKLTQKEIGNKLNLSQSQISRLLSFGNKLLKN